MSKGAVRVSDEELESTVRRLPEAFTILDFVEAFQELHPALWRALADRYGLYGSGTRYSALTYLSNRLSTYSRRKGTTLLEPSPTGWAPVEGRYLRRTTAEERERFGSRWIVVFRRVPER